MPFTSPIVAPPDREREPPPVPLDGFYRCGYSFTLGLAVSSLRSDPRRFECGCVFHALEVERGSDAAPCGHSTTADTPRALFSRSEVRRCARSQDRDRWQMQARERMKAWRRETLMEQAEPGDRILPEDWEPVTAGSAAALGLVYLDGREKTAAYVVEQAQSLLESLLPELEPGYSDPFGTLDDYDPGELAARWRELSARWRAEGRCEDCGGELTAYVPTVALPARFGPPPHVGCYACATADMHCDEGVEAC